MARFVSFLKSTWGRVVVILVIAAIAGGATLLVSRSNAKQYDGARQAADGFATAVAACDSAKAKQYFAGFSNASKLDFFKQHCVKSKEKLHFDHELNATTKTTKGVTTKSVFYDYALNEKGRAANHVLITVVWTSKNPKWLVVSATQATPPSAPPQKK